jgi:hypothetical protein
VAVLVASQAALLLVHDLSRRPVWTLALLAVGFGALAWSVLARPGGKLTPGGVVTVAVLLRIVLLPLPPTLSDDVLRYVWDGRVAGHGANPYALAPESDELEGLRDAEWRHVPHRDVETVYPPLALALFSIAAAAPRPVLAWKVLLVAIELAGCLLLLRLARRLGVPARRVALYAWNPLVTLEVAGMGHVDALGVTAVIATVWALEGRRAWAGLTAAAGVAAKLVPIFAVPLWARRAARPGRFAALTLGLVAAVLTPVLLSTGGVPPGWLRFGVSWEFNGPLFEPLWRLLDATRADDAIKSGLDRLKLWSGEHDFWNRFYPWVYPQWLAKLALGGLFAGWLVRIWRDRRAGAVEVTGRTFAALVVCSATVYPWYLLWMLPWAALTEQRAWLALSALILLSYLPQFGGPPLMPFVFLAIWIPFALLWWRHPKWSTD